MWSGLISSSIGANKAHKALIFAPIFNADEESTFLYNYIDKEN